MSASSPDGADGQGPPDEELHRVTDYEQTVAVINMLTDVRFKLATFVPLATGAAVALVRANEIEPIRRLALGIGGIVFLLGIVVYDLRNSQIYNGAIGRARELEDRLFGRYGGDEHPGLFGSRKDSDATHAERGTDRFLRLPVFHGTGLTLVYSAAFGAWAWLVLDALASWLRHRGDVSWQPLDWLQDDNNGPRVAMVLAVAAAFAFARQHWRHDPRNR